VNDDPLALGTGAGSSVVEHVTFNHVVVGSIPTPLTNESKHLDQESKLVVLLG
jgi:hypothetical protein